MNNNNGKGSVQGRLSGKIALVTGGAGGIGKATSLAYAAEGASVAVVDIDGKAAQAVADDIVRSGGDAISVAADLTDSEQVASMVAHIVAHYGRLDIAFNNAGIEVEREPLASISEDTFDDLMSVNVKGVWLCMKHEIDQMLEQGGGTIVNTASVAALVGAPRQPAYGTSKHAVLGMTKSAAVEYARKGIRINAVCPGVINTAMTERAIDREPRRKDTVARLHPIGRVGEAEEVANAVVFLSSDEASFVVGVGLPVDGGFTAV